MNCSKRITSPGWTVTRRSPNSRPRVQHTLASFTSTAPFGLGMTNKSSTTDPIRRYGLPSMRQPSMERFHKFPVPCSRRL